MQLLSLLFRITQSKNILCL